MQTSEFHLVKKAAAGDAQAFGELVDAYSGMVYAVALSVTGNYTDSEDVLQETFLRAYGHLGSLADPAKFAGWLGAIARNAAMDFLRKIRKAPLALEEEDLARQIEASAEAHASPADAYARKEIGQYLWEEVACLPAGTRQAILLYYADGFSVARAAEFLGITPAAFKMRLHAGREMLRDAMLTKVETELRQRKPDEKTRKQILSMLPVPALPMLPQGVSTGSAGSVQAALQSAGGQKAGLLLFGAAWGKIAAGVAVAAALLVAVLLGGSRGAPPPPPELFGPTAQETSAALTLFDAGGEVAALREGKGAASAMHATHAMRGRVLDAGNGEAIASARLTCSLGGQTVRETVSGAAGDFEFAGLPSGRYTVQVHSARATKGDDYVIAPDIARKSVTLGRSDVGSLEFRLSRGLALKGVVLSDDKPVSGVLVQIGLLRHEFLSSTLTTGEDGTFAFGGLRPAAGYSLKAKADGYYQTELGNLDLSSGKSLEGTVVRLKRGGNGSIAGRVVNRAKQPIESATVYVADGPSRERFMATDREGRFAAEAVAAGQVYVSDAMHTAVWRGALRPGEARRDIELVVDQPVEPGALCGVIRAADGKHQGLAGLVGVSTTGSGLPGCVALVADDGSFRIANLKPGQRLHVLYQKGMGGPFRKLTLAPVLVPAQDLVLTLAPDSESPGVRVLGRVLDAQSGEPIKAFRVAPALDDLARSGVLEEASFRNVHDASGAFILDNVKMIPGRSTVYAEADGYAGAFAWLRPDASTGQAYVEIRLTRGVGVEGRVEDEAGRPVAGAKVTEFYFSGRSAVSDKNGVFRLEALPARSNAALRCSHSDYAPTTLSPGKLKDGRQVQDLVVRMLRGASILGAVYDDASPVADATVNLRNTQEDACLFQAQTGRDGMYGVDHLPPGEYEVWVQDMDFGPLKVQTRNGEQAEADFGVSGTKLFGKITLAGKPLDSASVLLRQTGHQAGDGCIAQCSSDAQGGYTLKGVKPGRYSLVICRERQPMHTQAVDVTERKEQRLDIAVSPGTLRVHLAGGQAGEPLCGARVVLYDRAGMPAPGGSGAALFHEEAMLGSAMTDDSGTAVFDALAGGDYVVSVRRTEGASPVLADARGVEAGRACDVTVRLLEDARIRWVLKAPPGIKTPLAGEGALLARNEAGHVAMKRIEGGVCRTPLEWPAGVYSFSALFDDASGAKYQCPFGAPVRLEAGKECEVVLQLTR